MKLNTQDFKSLYVKDEKQIKKYNQQISELKNNVNNSNSKSEMYQEIGMASIVLAFFGGLALMMLAS